MGPQICNTNSFSSAIVYIIIIRFAIKTFQNSYEFQSTGKVIDPSIICKVESGKSSVVKLFYCSQILFRISRKGIIAKLSLNSTQFQLNLRLMLALFQANPATHPPGKNFRSSSVLLQYNFKNTS